jgi:Holliday junction resolvasome RuvABC endonuclease subunit
MHFYTIMAFDPGLHNLGWATLLCDSNADKPYCLGHGVIHIDQAINDIKNLDKHYRQALMLGVISEKVSGLLWQYLPDKIAVEETLLNKNPHSSLILAMARGALLSSVGIYAKECAHKKSAQDTKDKRAMPKKSLNGPIKDKKTIEEWALSQETKTINGTLNSPIITNSMTAAEYRKNLLPKKNKKITMDLMGGVDLMSHKTALSLEGLDTIEIASYHPNTIKKFVSGYGKISKELLAQVLPFFLSNKEFVLSQSRDATDAIAIGLCCCIVAYK